MIKAVRGATTVDSDSEEEVKSRVLELVDLVFKENSIDEARVVSLNFSITDDIQSINPAAALRSGGGYSSIPLFCAQEPKSLNSLKKAIRVLITYDGDNKNSNPIYLHGAKVLRPDLIN